MEEVEPPSLLALPPVGQGAPGLQGSNLEGNTFNRKESSLSLLAAYGWWLLGATVAALYAYSQLRPHLDRWRQQREDAQYHKDPDVALKRMEAVQRARERQQEQILAAARDHAQKQKEREEKKRAETLLRVTPGASSGDRLGARADYLPLAGAGTSGGYRPPKKSKCGGGGCGR